jgi:hypothetical protein
MTNPDANGKDTPEDLLKANGYARIREGATLVAQGLRNLNRPSLDAAIEFVDDRRNHPSVKTGPPEMGDALDFDKWMLEAIIDMQRLVIEVDKRIAGRQELRKR